MDKAEFLKELRTILADRLTAEELADVLSYYEAYFDDSEEDEAAVAECLGSPGAVAEQVLKDGAERPQASTPPHAAGRRPVLLWIIGAAVAIVVLSIFLLTAIRPADPPTSPGPSESAASMGAERASPEPAETSPRSSMPVGSDQDISVTLDPFETLKLDVDVASVQLKTGSEWKIHLVNRQQNTLEDSYQLDWSNSDGILSVWSTPYSDVPSSQRSADVRVEVTIPSGTALNQAELTIGIGSVSWDGCAVSGKLNVESGVGDVELNLAAPVSEADLITGRGDITLEIADDPSDYSWLLSTDTGDICLNGETMPPFWSEGGSGDRTLSLTSGTGDVSLDFQ